jgi:hypothetical protein
VIAARAINDGFLVAAIVNDTPLTANLMKVQLDGTTTTLGAYQRGGYSGFGRCWMEPGGALECAMALLTLEDAIVRFTLSAPPELLYDELGKKVKLHGSSLVTGP